MTAATQHTPILLTFSPWPRAPRGSLGVSETSATTLMFKSLSIASSNMLGFFVPVLVGARFFFTIIGVFGIWFAIGGVLLTVIPALVIVNRIPYGSLR